MSLPRTATTTVVTGHASAVTPVTRPVTKNKIAAGIVEASEQTNAAGVADNSAIRKKFKYAQNAKFLIKAEAQKKNKSAQIRRVTVASHGWSPSVKPENAACALEF
jgi:hypothetical protein